MCLAARVGKGKGCHEGEMRENARSNQHEVRESSRDGRSRQGGSGKAQTKGFEATEKNLYNWR